MSRFKRQFVSWQQNNFGFSILGTQPRDFPRLLLALSALALFFTLYSCKQTPAGNSGDLNQNQCEARRDGSYWDGSSCKIGQSDDKRQSACLQDRFNHWDSFSSTCQKPQTDQDCAKFNPALVFDGQSCTAVKRSKNFYRHCIDQEASPAIKATINTIREIYLSSSCLTVYQALLLKQELTLSSMGIVDLTPIGQLTHLTSLELRNNAITDMSPILPLVNLQKLDIGRNKLTSSSVVLSFTKLSWLSLAENQLTSVQGLERLSLKYLDLSGNQIIDLSTLKKKSFEDGFFYQGNPGANN